MLASSSRRFAADVSLGVLVPIALARVDPLVERLPSLGIFRGPAAGVLAAVAVGLVLARLVTRWRPGWAGKPQQAPTWLLWVVAAAL